MQLPSRQIADRYQIQLSAAWARWFDRDLDRLELPGEFRSPASADVLIEQVPACIWPGLMLPDTLPVLGNDYGDWICVRVGPDNQLGEMVHWYHGGGDWVPLGNCLGEAVLHDAIDSCRVRRGQVLRGANESHSHHHRQDLTPRLTKPEFIQWLGVQLASDAHRPILDAIAGGDFASGLQQMRSRGWAIDAVLCDQIEDLLQLPTGAIAKPSIAQRLGMNWEPDYVRWLFDLSGIPLDAFQQIVEWQHAAGEDSVVWSQQQWDAAEELAHTVLQRRSDLGWAVDIAGWAAQRRGDLRSAAMIYFRGRFASAFSNQSVRMRTHWFDQRFGKFSLAQLWHVRESLGVSDREDGYVQAVWQTPARLLQRQVFDYWMSAARDCMRQGLFADAYSAFYKAGWDLGAQRMTDYLDVLSGLSESAEAAGWIARSTLAATHLACLSKTLPKH